MARGSRRVGSTAAVLAGLLALGWASAAAAQTAPQLALSWEAPPGCATAEDVRARVATLLGGGASVSSVADVRAAGQVERVDNGFRLLLDMSVDSAPSSRIIEARTCDELAGAAAIAIALLARSTAEAESAPAASSTSNSVSAQPAELSPAPAAKRATTSSEEEPQRQTSRGLRFVLDAPLGVAGWGSLPGPAFGLGAGLGVRWKSLRVTARAELWQPQSHRVSGFDTRFTLQSGGLDACLIHELQGVEIAPCLGAAVQRLTGAGVASQVLSAVAEPQVTWISGAGGLFASLPTPGFAHLRFFGAASVLLSPARPRFVIDQLGPVHQPALAAPRLDLGCEWIF